MSDDFDALPRTLRKRIDNAFNSVLGLPSLEKSPRLKKKRWKVDNSSDVATPGGFIVDDSDVGGGFIIEDESGGFIVDEKDTLSRRPTTDNGPFGNDTIPYSLIPAALQILDLQPDDGEVLRVFRNAVSGWNEDTSGLEGDEIGVDDGLVSRTDWRAVCTVLLGDVSDGEEDPGSFSASYEAIGTSDAENGEFRGGYREDDDEDEDAYKESSLSPMSGSDPASDSDEYYEAASTSKSLSKSEVRKGKRKVSSRITPGAPTARQRQIALETFALFFPSPISDTTLLNKRLMFKDLVNISDILKEKLKAEEINEMLSLFSNSPDNAMSLDDFTRMMIMAKLAW